MRPEQPDTAANESVPPVVENQPLPPPSPLGTAAEAGAELPVAEAEPPAVVPVRKKKRRRRDPAEVAREAAYIKRLVRIVLLLVAGVLTAVFVAAVSIHPYDENGNPRSMSTHTQLGLPPCNFVVYTGKPCPSCGMTTSFALLVRGDVIASLRANWVGSVICVLWATTLVWAVASALWGKTLFIPSGRGEIVFTVIVGVVLLLMLSRWAVILIQ